mmetsp:Transcript_13558/g.24173  ORF Transcript_13558/g.24173 Transcript_13558/m.24173 type:complete len:210 (-) Transcript_13558:673-1302(-)
MDAANPVTPLALKRRSPKPSTRHAGGCIKSYWHSGFHVSSPGEDRGWRKQRPCPPRTGERRGAKGSAWCRIGRAAERRNDGRAYHQRSVRDCPVATMGTGGHCCADTPLCARKGGASGAPTTSMGTVVGVEHQIPHNSGMHADADRDPGWTCGARARPGPSSPLRVHAEGPTFDGAGFGGRTIHSVPVRVQSPTPPHALSNHDVPVVNT